MLGYVAGSTSRKANVAVWPTSRKASFAEEICIADVHGQLRVVTRATERVNVAMCFVSERAVGTTVSHPFFGSVCQGGVFGETDCGSSYGAHAYPRMYENSGSGIGQQSGSGSGSNGSIGSSGKMSWLDGSNTPTGNIGVGNMIQVMHGTHMRARSASIISIVVCAAYASVRYKHHDSYHATHAGTCAWSASTSINGQHANEESMQMSSAVL